MNVKCAIGASIGAPLLIAALVGLIWAMVIYDWLAFVVATVTGAVLLVLAWIALYGLCVEHHKIKDNRKE